MRFDVITLFPGMFRALEDEGVIARALSQGIAELHLWNPRGYAGDITAPSMTAPMGVDLGW
jgi:tRNA (guanine37-N1)-methyltransferase